VTASGVKAVLAVRPDRTRVASLGALRASLARLGPAIALVVVVLAFALLTEAPSRYLSAFTLRMVLSLTVIFALGAIGITIFIISGGIDLSVGASIALTGAVAAWAAYRRAQPLGRLGTPEERTAAALWLVSLEASFVTGVARPADRGFTAL
jgi:ribose/xylose/arabinose/galactoside ABC-type transport system permease subunit